MSYRPITDIWILARAKLKDGSKYYGCYPGGFPERARALLGVTMNDPVLHVCGGMVRQYPYKNAIGPNDKTLDLDPALEPDFLQDARKPFPELPFINGQRMGTLQADGSTVFHWPAILMDPPYSEPDAEHYVPGASAYPSPNLLLKNALEAVRPGGRVGLLHYVLPQPPKTIPARFVACVGVIVGFNNRIRVFSVFEREANP
jgi:hypothetical protein